MCQRSCLLGTLSGSKGWGTGSGTPSVLVRRRRGAIDSSGMCQRDDTMESGKHMGIHSTTPRKRIDRFENEKGHNHVKAGVMTSRF
jgi:hypothetical protein